MSNVYKSNIPMSPMYEYDEGEMANNDDVKLLPRRVEEVAPLANQTPPPRFAAGPDPVRVTCPHCSAVVKTCIKYSVTTRTHTLALRCCILCCCCLPYCMDTARNVDHFCPNCKATLGTYEK